MMKNITLLPGESLYSFLTDQCELSASQLKKHFSSKSLKGLKKRLHLESDRPQEYALPLNLLNHHCINPRYSGPDIELVYEDQDFLCLNKPVGVHGHPLDYEDQLNCLSFLRHHGYSVAVHLNTAQRERGLLYRLDRDTSGVLLFAKSQMIFDQVKNHRRDVFKSKYYLAVTEVCPQSLGDARLNFIPSEKKGRKMIAVTDSRGQSGQCEIEILLEKEGYFLLGIKLREGIRHQIRATLEFLKAPIVGDQLYGGQAYERLALHSYCYIVSLPNFKTKVFKARTDDLFNRLLNLDCLTQVLQDKVDIC